MGNLGYTETTGLLTTGESFRKKVFGKPYEGKPHVRFDEGAMETKHGYKVLRHC